MEKHAHASASESLPEKVRRAEDIKKSATRALGGAFEVEYRKLNAAQKLAVDTLEGPVLVIAGPGTGKTQVLAMRAANILRRTQMRPGNILCLTFSVSGAFAMRERLRLLIGADAYGVTVSTIHGFCQSVIGQHPQIFEEWSLRDQISDIEKSQELNTIIDQVIQHSKLLNQKDPYGRNGDLLARISQVKREGKTIEDLERVAGEFEVVMREKSKDGTKAHAKNLLAAEKVSDFVEIFRLYQEMLERKGKYDYDDMILFVIRALREEEALLASLQERYQYILVDEAQDTNGAQWEVVELLTTYAALPHDPNFFVVGDDDQAIYRFQGANLCNMLRFHERFPRAPVIALTRSYRSTQSILDAARTLIEKNDERLVGKIPGLQKTLTAVTDEKGTMPLLLRSSSDAAEPWLIADLIDERLRAGIPSTEIAVLTQTNAELFPLYDVLRARKIPVLLHGKTDLLGHPLVTEALAILRSLLHLQSDSALLSALGAACLACHPADLSRLALLARGEKRKVHEVLLDLESTEVLFLRKDALIAARDAVLSLAHTADSRTVLELTEQVLRLVSSGESARDPLDLAAVEAFFQYAKQQCLDTPSLSFRGFLRDLEFYADPAAAAARLSFAIPHLVTEGVALMTAHQSKGLEFHTVILSNFREGHWDERRKPGSVPLPEDLLFGWEKEQKSIEQHEDERRVTFVAMTRAKRELLFTCPREIAVGEKHKPVSPSAFFAEAGELPEEEARLREPEKAALLRLHPIRNLDSELQAYVRERLENFSLSATSLSRFLRDPQEFLRVDLLGQPEHFDEKAIRGLGYGSAVHWALKEWATALQRGEELSADKMVGAFRWYLEERTILTAKQRLDLLTIGADALPRYFEQKLKGTRPFLHAIERDYRARLGDIPLKGKIDRIDRKSDTSGQAFIIDYKTGVPKTPAAIRGGVEEGAISRTDDGAQFRQLVFYALLLEQGDPLLEPQSYSLEFIGERGEDPLHREFTVTDQEKDSLRKLICDVWAKVTALDFSPL